ncbi:MAG: DUF120 domain-containing protein [Nanoarchaeota archaeon]
MPALEGTVVSGLGKGAVFIAIDYYKSQIREKLGFVPYHGTLNIATNKNNVAVLEKINPIRIESFKKDGKAYGGADCYKIKIKGINGAIIVPDLTEHEDIIEIIAPVNLKSALKIKEGDKVKVELI